MPDLPGPRGVFEGYLTTSGLTWTVERSIIPVPYGQFEVAKVIRTPICIIPTGWRSPSGLRQ